ncbi:hypothetical protein HIM_09780 [Hirsutella minnesotensis 3608]|uniref:NAD(P)-binding domain-containing protein n=1 Tax=Hirsutella minnesotensis 3608 TaxID=1043627 RepID=A0A0F7ZGF9_9HYPO|nr:hypothetical protein HIM_09780 [Hirsutella minnesotensis 3608]
MTAPIRKATGKLGSHILTALIETGFEVIAVQRKDSPNTLPHVINSVRADLTKQEDLMVAFNGEDAVVSAVPTPKFATEKIMIDAALAASVKRSIPWTDIGKAVAKVLGPSYFDETANQAVYMYSAAVNERMLTDLASKVTGIDFGTIEGGQIANVDVDQLMQETDEKWKKGDKSVVFNYFYQTMYGKGYGGGGFKEMSWNDGLGLKTMTDDDIEEAIRHAAKGLGILE